MCSGLNKHELEFSLRVKHEPIKEFMRERQNGVNDEQYRRQMCVCHIISTWRPFSRNVGNRFNSDYEFCSGEPFTMKIITVWEELHKFTFNFHTMLSRQTKLPGSLSWNTVAWTWDKPQTIRSTSADFRCPGQATCFHTHGQCPMHATQWSDMRYIKPTEPWKLARSNACPIVVIPKSSGTAGTLQNATDSAKFPLFPNCLNWRRNP